MTTACYELLYDNRGHLCSIVRLDVDPISVGKETCEDLPNGSHRCLIKGGYIGQVYRRAVEKHGLWRFESP